LILTNGLATSSVRVSIIDPDGTVVWLPPAGTPLSGTTARAHLSWDAKRLVAIDVNYPKDGFGVITSITMDGSDSKTLDGASAVHHDLTAIPGGVAALAWAPSTDTLPAGPSSLIEFLDSGETKTVVADLSTLYDSGGHANSVHYYDADHSYTIGDPLANAYVKITRDGELVWQFGGANPKDPTKFFAGVTPWEVNHGHHLSADGTFAFFNNAHSPDSSNVLVYQLDAGSMQATRSASFPVPPSAQFGDVQHLPNGNFLVTASNSGKIFEVTPAGSVVMTIDRGPSAGFGYTEFRKSLYGPPPY
jgi:hypothetical protein